MALDIQRLLFDPITGDSPTAAFRKLDNSIGEIAELLDGGDTPENGLDARLAAAENDIDVLQTGAASLDTRVTTAQTAATNAGAAAAAAQTTANTAKTNADTATTKANAAQATANAAVPATTLASYGLGVNTLSTIPNIDAVTITKIEKFQSGTSTGSFPTSQPYGTIQTNAYGSGAQYTQLAIGVTNQEMAFRYYNGGWQNWCRVWHSANTTVDSNGFIKKAN
jgi:hypothetical protein